jgi:hypothetical protein
MKIEIKNRNNGDIIIAGKYDSIKDCLEKNTDANLIGADLRGANLRDANLIDANLIDANLRGANLIDANLRDANLIGADLRGACLIDANLRGANLIDANLRGADLRGACLIDANLRGADLRGANLIDANLRDANLRGADLRDAHIDNDYLTSLTSICPEGNIIGWKKCVNEIIVKLMIPKKAKRSNATGRKCRAEYAKVLEIIGAEEAVSLHDPFFKYKVGKTVKCDNWNDNRWNECSGGIHFFITRDEAERW